MKYPCQNGNTVERFYDRKYRASVTRTLGPDGEQIGDAEYDGNKISANYSKEKMIKANGGLVPKPNKNGMKAV